MSTTTKSLLDLRFANLRELLHHQVGQLFSPSESARCLWTQLRQRNIKLSYHTTLPEGKLWQRNMMIGLKDKDAPHQPHGIVTAVTMDFAQGVPTTTLVSEKEEIDNFEWSVPYNAKGDMRMGDVAEDAVRFLKEGRVPIDF